MGIAKVGDMVKVVKTFSAGESGYVGKIGEVVRVHDFDNDTDIYDVEFDDFGEVLEFYEEEVILAEAPKDYEEAKAAAKDADVSTWVAHEDVDEYNEIVISLSQAIADKAKEMAERPLLIGEHFSMGTETPVHDMPEEDDTDAAIFTELRGHRQEEVFGVLQDGISVEQAREAMQRAKRKVREDEVKEAKFAYEIAMKKLEEFEDSKKVDGDISAASMFSQANTPVPFIAESPNPMGNVMDNHWINDEPRGKEVIYDAYNPDVVKAPAHYVNSGIEPIQYMADKLPAYEDGHTAFCIGNVIKYVSRAPHKGKLIEDLRKAAQYLEFAIEHEEKKQG